MAYSESDPKTANRGGSKEAPDASSSWRYRFRADLEVAPAIDAGITGGDVTVIDPRTGDRHVFTADELCLCRSADGTNTLAAIRLAFKAETGREISHGKLFALFRRLHSLGLLEQTPSVDTADKPALTAATVDEIRRRTEARFDATANRPMRHDESPMTAAPAGSTLTPLPVEGQGAPEPAAGPIPVEPSDSSAADFGDEKRRARRRRMMQSRWRGDKPTSRRASAGAAPAKEAEVEKPKVPTAQAGETYNAEKAGAAAGGIGESFEDLELPGLVESGKTGGRPGARRRQRGARRTEARGKAGTTAPAGSEGSGSSAEPAGAGTPATLPDAADADDFGAAFGGGMGAGGLRVMLGGEGRGLRGGGMQNLLAALAQRGRAGRQDGAAEGATDETEPARISLFNPNAVLGMLAALTWPLKYLFVPLLLLVPATVWIAYEQREILAQDIRAFDASVVATVVLGLFIVNFICRLTQAIFIRSFGGRVQQFGIVLTFGIPRFFVDLGGIGALDRRAQLWVHAAPELARLGLFCAGTLLWLALRQSAASQAHLALVVGQIGLLSFLLSALPLLHSDGYRWLATYFGHVALRDEALGNMPGHVSEIAEDSDTASGSPAVTFYVLAVALAVSALALVAQAYFDVVTAGEVRLLTAAFLLGLCIALAAWGIALWNYGRGRAVIETLESDAARLVLANWRGHADIATDRPVTIGTVGKVLWAVVACALVAVAFLPYHYNPSGTFEILPTARTAVATRTSGDLEQVLVHEGDWVHANQALAKLSSDDQQREITITRAELDRAKAQLAQFGGKTASTQGGDPGLDALNKSIADALSDEPDTAGAKNDSTASYYTKTQAERAARAEVERLTRKLAYARDQLADTTVRAPKDGRVMTPNVHLLTGIFLRRGAELLSLADTRTLEAQIDIPEADIGLVKVGDKVRIRPWSDEDREIAGTVTEIAPAAQTRSYGTVVRVRASVPNDEASLRPAMTGYAKIDGENMRVWEAFLGRIVRIVRVEMWSWIP